MSLSELYQDVILDHNRRPRRYGQPGENYASAEGTNPLCGDSVTVFVRTEDDRIADIRFVGSGCAISTASASLMAEAVAGKTVAEALALFQHVHDAAMGAAEPDEAMLGEVAAICGVREFPARVKCATLAWHTLREAIAEAGK